MKPPFLSRSKRFTVAFLALFCFGSVLQAERTTPEGKILEEGKTPIRIAKAGQSLVPIVISPDSSEAVKKTAAELAGYLKRITGAGFAIEQGREAKGITLGTLAQFPDESLKEPMTIKEGYDGVEAFAIRSDEGRIRLLGNTDLGVEHAAYRFLELLGCRWFFQGETWEIVPAIPDLTFNLNEISRPDIWSRNIWFGRAKQEWEKGDPDANAAYDSWAKGNRMGMSLKFNVSHNWHAIPTAFKEDGSPYKKEFEAHPEYFALVDGKRNTAPFAQFCVTNPGLQKLVIQYANRYFEKNPDADMVSLDPADQPGWCTCPECEKLGPHSTQAFYLANLVAKEIQKTHPGKYVGLLAYSWHSDPPDFLLEPNVYVQLTAGMNASKFSFDELFKAWTEKCGHMGIYEYYSYWEMDKSMLPGTGVANKLDDLGPRMLNFANSHVASISAQAANNWGVNGLGYYLGARLMWDASSDTKALRKDFYEKAFGPASAPMERYFERLNLSNLPLTGRTLLRQSVTDLEEAAALAKTRPDVLARIKALQENLVYNYLGRKVELAEGDEEAVKKATLDWFTWAFRTRNNYMNGWIDFRSTVGRPAAEKLGEKTWFWRNTGDNPWKKNEPVTPEELSGLFQKIKSEWGELPAFTERKFSKEFVLTQSGREGSAERNLQFSGSAALLLASLKGEPLRFKLVSIPSPQHERRDATYSLTAPDGSEISAGQLPEGENSVELKVPGPGVYGFFCRRTGQGWSVELPGELAAALCIKRDVDLRPVRPATYYFYVPKGTSQITMHLQWGTVEVRDPNSQVAFKGRSEGELIALPVNDGTSGKVWSISGKFRGLWFLDIPTVLSLSPDMIFVPKEVAEKDGLKVVLP